MLKRYVWLALATVFFVCNLFIGTASAFELDEDVLTVPLDDAGETITLTEKQLSLGRQEFKYACAICHVGGKTKTNPNVGMGPDALANATPNRNTIEGLVDYMKNPTTYDGLEEIAELHPSIKSKDIFPKMRTLSDEDLEAIAGYILVQPKVVGDRWAGGKAYN